MVIARFEFNPEAAEHFTWNPDQLVVEMMFDSIMELIEFCQEFEEHITDCTVFTGSDVISLKAFVS